MSYPLVQIHNSTNYPASGTVDYESIFCSNDNYQVDSDQTWTAGSRGVCLVTQITAVLRLSGQDVQATPYTSSGTAYSQFVIVSLGNNQFAVTRNVSGAEDEAPADHEEPSTQQK